MENEKLLLSKREVAHLLSLSLRTVDNLLKRNLLMAKRIGRRTLILKSSLDQFFRTIPATVPRSDTKAAGLPERKRL
jgi:excisionase family DNA binding protein